MFNIYYRVQIKSVPFIAPLYTIIKGAHVQLQDFRGLTPPLVILSIAFKYFHSTSRTEVTKINDFKLQGSLGRKDILYWRKRQKPQRHEVICLKPLGKWKQSQSCAVTTASSFHWASPPKKIKINTGRAAGRNCLYPSRASHAQTSGLIRLRFASTGPKMALTQMVSPGYVPASSLRICTGCTLF